MELVSCRVGGMSCSSCTMTVSGYLEKKGMQEVVVGLATGEVSFNAPPGTDVPSVLAGIDKLGYKVILPGEKHRSIFSSAGLRFFFCLLFTLPLVGAMWIPWNVLHLYQVQWLLATPVYLAGMQHFGKNALGALKSRLANMDLLITVGASAAYFYSLAGLAFHLGNHYQFFETSSLIITLVLLGNLLEQKTVKQTASAMTELARIQVTKARRILPDGSLAEVASQDLVPGDEVLVNAGDYIPADGEIFQGEGSTNESMITGESTPVSRYPGDRVIGGSLLDAGTLKMRVTATGRDTVLSYIIELVRQAQNNKTPMQKLADRISAVFVPAVLGIAGVMLLAGITLLHLSFPAAMLRAIAILVIACPCAMGLATPAAVMTGLGRAARNGILIRGAHLLEQFHQIRTVVFDKTGTLTTGKLQIRDFASPGIEETTFKTIVANLELHSSHPIGKSILQSWKPGHPIPWKSVAEIKGSGIQATDQEGGQYLLGSYWFIPANSLEQGHDLYLAINGHAVGWLDLGDDLRPGTSEVIRYLRDMGLRVILLSGDRQEKCDALAALAGISEVYARQSPAGKLQKLEELVKEGPVVMVGDGINDAPALAAASIGVSLSDASQVAQQSAGVVLMNNRLDHLPLALAIGRHTYRTIKENLFWAFFYNIIAIPIAAAGLLSPALGAASMGMSDLFLIANSIRLRYKKLL